MTFNSNLDEVLIQNQALQAAEAMDTQLRRGALKDALEAFDSVGSADWELTTTALADVLVAAREVVK